MAAFALLPCALLAIYAALADGPAESRALRGLIRGVAGTGFVVPAVGVEVFAMPVIARLYLDGVTGVAPALRWIYWGPTTLVMIVGLITLARRSHRARACDMAKRCAARLGRRSPSRWVGAVAAAPAAFRIVDGLTIGLGGLWLAWAIWRKAARTSV